MELTPNNWNGLIVVISITEHVNNYLNAVSTHQTNNYMQYLKYCMGVIVLIWTVYLKRMVQTRPLAPHASYRSSRTTQFDNRSSLATLMVSPPLILFYVLLRFE